MHTDLLLPGAHLSPLVIEQAVRRALDEDLGRAGDITSAATIPAATRARARLVARKAGVLAGLACAAQSFRAIDPSVSFRAKMRDGGKLAANETIAEIEGPAIAVLSGERVALNFVGHLSGIATLTAAYVAKVAHTGAKIVDTRKTLPGLRALEKYAVRCGGGANHRFGLDDAVLIKDNHIAVAGGVAAALNARARRGRSSRQDRDRSRPARSACGSSEGGRRRQRSARQHGHGHAQARGRYGPRQGRRPRHPAA